LQDADCAACLINHQEGVSDALVTETLREIYRQVLARSSAA
jgi:hypothetical protein